MRKCLFYDILYVMIIDAHTHLNTNQMFGDYKVYLQNFEKIGGKIVVNAGANNEYNNKGIQISKESEKEFPNLIVKTAIGWHPCDIPHNEVDFLSFLNDLEKLYEENKDYIVAIGECGIDLHFPENPAVEIQQYAFRKQAEFARKLNLSLMIHSREAFRETMEVLKDFSDLKIYFHAWGYGKDELEECEKTFPNLWIGCTNVIEYPSAENIRESLRHVKTSKILTETDAPFLPPQTMRGQQNEPAYVTYVYEKLCEILGIEQKELEKIIENNTKLLYQIKKES